MANEDDLVSKVVVQGTAESEALLEHYAAVGEASFAKVAAAATASGAAVAAAGKQTQQGAKDAAGAVDQLNAKKIDPSNEAALKSLERQAFNFGNNLRKSIKDVAEFTARIAVMGAGAVAGGAALLKLASGVAKASQGTSSALDKQTESQIDANNKQLAGAQGAINYESAQRKLTKQLQQGKIDYKEYNTALQSLRDEYNEQIRVSAELQNAEERTREANERLKKSAEDRKAYTALIDTWGGPMLSALTALGTTTNQLGTQFKNAFGPAVAGVLDIFNNSLSKNSAAITTFFDQAAAKINTFVSQNGPAIQKAIEGIGSVLGGIFNGIIDALPTLVILFNSVLLPTLNAVGAALTVVANAFNAVGDFINGTFGTSIPKITPGVIALGAAFLYLSGGFKLIVGLIPLATSLLGLLFSPMGPWIILIGALAAAIYLLVTKVDWQAFAVGAENAINKVVQMFTDFPKNLGIIWEAIKATVSEAWNGIVEAVKGAWQAVVDYFAAFPGNLQLIWDTVKQAIIDAFNSAVQTVKNYFSDLAASAKSYLQPIIDMLKSIISLGSSAEGSGSGGGSKSFSGGGKVTGPGTSTSDSIAAWLSNHEFVMKAKAVRKYGVSFMNAINRGDLDPSRMLGFAAGGLVQQFTAPRPSFAMAGTQAGSGRTAQRILNLTIGDQTFSGMTMPEDTAEALGKFAIKRQSASAGRKPSWMGKGSR